MNVNSNATGKIFRATKKQLKYLSDVLCGFLFIVFKLGDMFLRSFLTHCLKVLK